MKKIPAFRAGTHTDMNGKTITFNREHLIATANAYNPTLHEAPIVIGHPLTDDPAYGWIDHFAVEGDELIAIPVQVEPVFGEMVDKGRFKKISMSFYEPNHPANPKQGVWYPKHVGFLGATPPAIKGLKPIAFGEGDDNATFTAEFADGSPSEGWDGLMKALQTLFSYVAVLNPFPKEPDVVETASTQTVPTDPALPFYPNYSENSPVQKENTMTDQTVTAPVTPVAPSANPAPATPAVTSPVTIPVTTSVTTAPAQPDINPEAYEAMKKELAEMKAQSEKDKDTAKTNEHVAYAENLVTAGKLSPAQKDVTVAILNQLESGSQTVSFGEGDTAKPLANEFKAFLDTLPVNPMFGESATRGNAPHAQTVAYGENTDPSRIVADQQVRAYAKENNVSYAEAAHAVLAG